MSTNERLEVAFEGCSIAPPDILIQVAEHGRTREDRDAATRTLAASASLRARRGLVRQMIRQNLASVTSLMPTSTGEQNTVYDVAGGGSQQLPGTRKRRQSDPPSDDVAVNQAWEGADETYRFYSDVLGRNSVDDRGMELVSSVHFGSNFDNAFWNGSQMVYGDGSGRIFVKGGLTAAIDVIGHELTHGVTQYTAGLEYSSQPGALNESFSDVFGSHREAAGAGADRRSGGLADRRRHPGQRVHEEQDRAAIDEGARDRQRFRSAAVQHE